MRDFKERLDVPKSYQMNDITKRVLNPIIRELNLIFRNLHINKIKAKKGRKIEWLEFSFEPEKSIHSKRQKNMINSEKSKQNNNREMTPKWLKDNRYEAIKSGPFTFTEEERQVFLKNMNKI